MVPVTNIFFIYYKSFGNCPNITHVMCWADRARLVQPFNHVVNPPARELVLTRTLPKCISFLRMNGKGNVVISEVFGDVDYESKVKISKFKMADSIWRSHTQNLIIFKFSWYDWPENDYSDILRLLKTFVNPNVEMVDQIWRPYIRFPVRKIEDSRLVSLKTIIRVF